MPNRMKSSSSLLTVRRTALYDRVLRTGVVAQTPCSHCILTQQSCIVLLSSSYRCAECIRLARTHCDNLGVSRTRLLHIVNECAVLRTQLDATENEVRLHHSQLRLAEENVDRLRLRLYQLLDQLDASVRNAYSDLVCSEASEASVENSSYSPAVDFPAAPRAIVAAESSVATLVPPEAVVASTGKFYSSFS